MQNHPSQPEAPSSRPFRLAWVCGPLLLAGLIAFSPSSLQAAWMQFTDLVDLRSEPVAASPALLSEHVIEGLADLKPQKQAEVLLQRAVNHYSGAIELISQHVDGWRGRITLTPQFSGMLGVAINSNDLRVRAAAIEIYLAAYNLAKDEGSFTQLAQRVADDPASRPWALWMLGALGNRGVQSSRALDLLRTYAGDRSEEARYWAVEGLAMLGGEPTVQPLLDIFKSDPAARVRERAACSLAQSGMLAREQRMKAVPQLLDMAQDPGLDATTRTWTFQALRDITGENHGSDAGAWRAWWNQRAR